MQNVHNSSKTAPPLRPIFQGLCLTLGIAIFSKSTAHGLFRPSHQAYSSNSPVAHFCPKKKKPRSLFEKQGFGIYCMAASVKRLSMSFSYPLWSWWSFQPLIRISLPCRPSPLLALRRPLSSFWELLSLAPSQWLCPFLAFLFL